MQFISALFPIREALRLTGTEQYLNEYLPDLIEWSYQAEKKIWDDTPQKALWYETVVWCGKTMNNTVVFPDGLKYVEYLKVGDYYPVLNDRAPFYLKPNCPNKQGSPFVANVNNNVMTFQWAQDDGTDVLIQYARLRLDEQGVIMVHEEHFEAISAYCQWKLLTVKGNAPLAAQTRSLWLHECNQARSRTNKYNAAEIASVGSAWALQFPLANTFGIYNYPVITLTGNPS